MSGSRVLEILGGSMYVCIRMATRKAADGLGDFSNKLGTKSKE